MNDPLGERQALAKKLLDLRPSFEQLEKFEQVRQRITSIVSGFEGQFEKIREALKFEIPENFKIPSWEEQDQDYRARLKMLAEHGWFAGMDFPLVTLNRADAMFRQGQETEANQGLTLYFNDKAPEIIRQVSEQYPETSILMARALRAHQEEDYAVAVLILLSQAEGIWGRHATFSPYSRTEKSKEALQKAIDGKSAQLPIRAYWELLLQDIPITRRFDKAEPAPDGLNRHAVMHGASLNFGSKLNSSRAFSWLSFTAEIRGFFGLFEHKK